jgi:uncharacterized membrane protein YfcA
MAKRTGSVPKTDLTVAVWVAMLEVEYVWLFVSLVALGAFTQGFTGIGFGIIILAGIAFTSWDFERSTVVVSLLVLFIHAGIIYSSLKQSQIRWDLVGFILVGLIFGVPLGYLFIIKLGHTPVFRLVFGATLFLLAAHELWRPRLRSGVPKALGALAGAVGGFLSGAFTAAGPPIAMYIYTQHKKPVVLKGTLQFVFMCANLWRLVNIVFLGRGITPAVVRTTAVALPVVLLFGFLGHRLSHRVSSRTFLRIVYSFIAIAGVLNIVRGLM